MSKKPPIDTQDTDPSPKQFRIEEAIGALVMGLICLISISNVVVRYATDISFAFTEEYSVFLLVVLTFIGASLAYATNDHLRISFFADRFGPVGKELCRIISVFASLIMFGLLVYYGFELTFDEYIYEETSPGLGNPAWIYTICLPVLSLAIIFRIVQTALSNRGGKKT